MKLFSVLAVSVLLCRPASSTTLAEVKSLPSFNAVLVNYKLHEDVTHQVSLTIKLRKIDGSDFVITEPQATLFQVAFATSLKRGQTNAWPEVLLDFSKARTPKPDPLQKRAK